MIVKGDKTSPINFCAVRVGEVFRCGTQYFLKIQDLATLTGIVYNAVTLESGGSTSLSPQDKVVAYPNAVVFLSGEEG